MVVAPQAEHIRFLFDPRATLSAFARQRRRFAASVEALSDDELASPSRCAEWTVADVLRHLVWVDHTMHRIWSGDVSIPKGFDPRTTPNDAVNEDRSVTDREILDRYLGSTETMAAEMNSSEPDRYGQPSVSPAGAVPWWMSAVHIGWDSSIHERDVLLPLSRTVESPDDETALCLAYSLILTSFFAGRDPMAVCIGDVELTREEGPVTAQAHGNQAPDSSAVLETTDRVACIDAISGRGALESVLWGDTAIVYRLGGLARYFTSPSG